jgi:hypothetical protein
MAVASVAALWPLRNAGVRGLVAVIAFAPFLSYTTLTGNVQPLMVLTLTWGLERRSGPLIVALNSSLKAFPLAFVLTYAGRRQWRRVALTIGLTAGLIAPMLLFDLTAYTFDPGFTLNPLVGSPWLYLSGVATASLITIVSARTRYGPLAGSVTMLLAKTRLLHYDLPFLLVSLARRPTPVIPKTDSRFRWYR